MDYGNGVTAIVSGTYILTSGSGVYPSGADGQSNSILTVYTDGTTIKWYHERYAFDQANDSGATYYYIAVY